MPFLSVWGNPEKTIVYLLYEQPWSWPEFKQVIVQANSLMDEVNHPVDMIIYMHGGMPRDVGPWQFRAVIRDFHPNLRSTALVGVNAFIRQTINAFMRVMGQDHRKFFFAGTLEEAMERISALNTIKSATG